MTYHPQEISRVALPTRNWIIDPASFQLPEGVETRHAILPDHEVTFAIRNPNDRIQRKHRKGKYYEPDELAVIKDYFKPAGVFCDLGANIGNHTLFALLSLGASKSIVIEPNPDAYELLVANLCLNGLVHKVDLRHLGLGVGSEADAGFGIEAPEKNLGAGVLTAGSGNIELRTADSLLAGDFVDFIKIDVEGMENEVIAGLKQTLSRCKPVVFAEIEHDNNAAFCTAMAEAGYTETVEIRRLRFNRNAIFSPNS